MQKVESKLSTYRKNEDKQLMKWLVGLLYWFASKIKDDNEQVVIVVTKEYPPTFYRTLSNIKYIPPETVIEQVTLKTSDWKCLNNIKSLRLETVQELLEKFVPGIKISQGEPSENVEGLIIDWKQIKIRFVEDDQGTGDSKRIPIPYRVLAFLEMTPTSIVKGRGSFSSRLVLELKEKGKIVYVGEGATYIFNENGFSYLAQSNLNDFKLEICADRIGIIEHREKDSTRASFKRKVKRYIG